MSEKQNKKLKRMAALFYQIQPKDMPNRKSLSETLQNLKQIHKNKKNDSKRTNRNA